ncbi:MAG: glycosyltransferase [Phycisphaerae bacterium]|nr:glycosyltransferase [Phycisphaerae bacterium]
MLDHPRILQLANEAGPLRLFVLPVCDALQKAGADVELACMAGGPNFEPLRAAGYPLHALPRGQWKNPLACWRIYRGIRELFKQKRYDLLVVHTPVMSWLARLAARDCVGATIYVAHGLPFTARQPWYVRRLFLAVEKFAGRYTDAVLVMNREDEAACRRYRLTRPGGFCRRIPGVGVDVAAYEQPLDEKIRHELDEQFHLRSDKPLLLYLGRFIPAKRPGDILTLAERLGDRADIVMAGEGSMWEEIHERAKRLGPHVHVLGWTDRCVDLVRRCDIAVFPSVYREGLPRFLLEAAAAGKPAIAYDVRGSRDVIENNQTGLLIPPGDVEAFCNGVQMIIEKEEICRRMGRTGQERIAEQFTLQKSVTAQANAFEPFLRNFLVKSTLELPNG